MRFLLGLLVVPLMWGCEKPSDDRYIEQNPRKKIEENLAAADVYCESPGSCPESVGYILANVGENRIGQCTGWLIAPDIVATNSHCISDEMKADPSLCAANLGIKFAKTNGRDEEILYCAELLHFSKIAAEGEPDFIRRPDFAFFRVSKATERKPFVFSRAGITEAQEISLLSVDPMSKSRPRGRLIKRTCRASKNAVNIPGDTSELSDVAVVFGDDCNARQGNSGSPVIDGEGRAIGWLHGGIPAGQDPADSFKDKTLIESTLKRPVILTNGACVPELKTVLALGAPGTECTGEARNKLEALRKQEHTERLVKIATEKMRGTYARWVSQAANVFKYSATASLPVFKEKERKVEVTVDVQTVCLLPKAFWRESHSTSAYSFADRARMGAPATLTVLTLAPKLEVEIKIDPLWRVTFAVQPKYENQMKTTLDPYQLAKPGMKSRVGGTEEPFTTRDCLSTEFEGDLPLVIKL